MAYFLAAEKCQRQISNIAEEGSLASRYCLVLEELRMEAKTQTRGRVDHPGQHDAPNGTLPQTEFASSAGHDNAGGSFGDMNGRGIGFNESPSDTLADMTSWEQFDSMVRFAVETAHPAPSFNNSK